jgi:hypothetical protein
MSMMYELGGRHAAHAARLVDSVLASPGHSSNALRQAVFTRALGSDPLSPSPSGPHPLSPSPFGRGGTNEELPVVLAAYVDKVARHAYKVTDEDVVTLLRAGSSDDALFELTVSAALGAALLRLERGLAALRASPPVPLSASSSPPVPLSLRERGDERGPA